MQKLGIVDISLQLKSNFQSNRSTKSYPGRSPTPSGPTSIRSRGPTRRSSRLKNATPVSYAEVHVSKKDEASYMEGITLEEGEGPEIYTQEHETLLGNTDKTWTLFVDGYGKDGKRIYDPVRGKTCHQCRKLWAIILNATNATGSKGSFVAIVCKCEAPKGKEKSGWLTKFSSVGLHTSRRICLR